MAQSPFDSTPLVIGHRGAAGLLPENTLPSFRRAAELGVQAVELDIHNCQGNLVVIHDEALDRTTNGLGLVAETPLEALRRLDAGNGAVIPLLEEVFAALPQQIGINVELKGKNTAAPLAEWLPDPAGRAVLISSFDHQALRDFQSVRTDYPLAPLYGRWKPDAVDTALAFQSGFINVSTRAVTAGRLAEIRAAGLKALVYTVNDLSGARRLVDWGAWGIFTDYPDRISAATL